MTTYIHEDRHHHQPSIEADQRGVLGEPVLHDKPPLDCSEEVVVEAGVDQQDENLGNAIPDIVDFDKPSACCQRGGFPKVEAL
jgi:hypothetical protein